MFKYFKKGFDFYRRKLNYLILLLFKGINKFSYLQNVNLSNNNLTTLEQLSGLRHLVKLDVSNNKLTDMFDFE